MPPDDGVGHQRSESRRVVAAVLDVVQCPLPDLEPGLVGFVPLRHPSVEIPAVEVEARLRGQRADLVERLRLELLEADDHVGDLHARVIDVVLHFHRHASEAQDADERIAQRRIAQVADVRRLVRVDRRVLDDGLARVVGGPRRRCAGRDARAQERRAIQVAVQVAVRRRFDTRDAFDLAQGAREVLRDRLWRLAQAPRQLEGDGQRQIAERARWRIVDDDGRLIAKRDPEVIGEQRRQARPEEIVNRKNHRSVV